MSPHPTPSLFSESLTPKALFRRLSSRTLGNGSTQSDNKSMSKQAQFLATSYCSSESSLTDEKPQSSSDFDCDSQSKNRILKQKRPFADSRYLVLSGTRDSYYGYVFNILTCSSFSKGFSQVIPWLCTLTAAVLLHMVGLVYAVWPHWDGTWNEIVLAVTGSLCEGTCLLLMLHRLAYATIHFPCQWWRRQHHNISYSKTTWSMSLSWRTLCGIFQTLAPALTFVALSFIILTSTLGDVYYREESGGLTPEIWVLAAFYLNASEYIRAKLVANATPDETSNITSSSSNPSDDAAPATTSRQEFEDRLAMLMIACYFGAMAWHMVGQWYQFQWHRKCRPSSTSTTTATRQSNFAAAAIKNVDCRNNKLLLIVTVATLFAYGWLEAWSPVTHALLCFGGRWFFVPGGNYRFDFVTESVSTPDRSQVPNVIYLVHESLSGSILENTNGGKHATPFFQSLLTNDDFYLFPHARSVSGDTRDCTTALLTGCLPIDEAGRQIAYGRSMGTEFKRRGYATMSVTSYPMNFDETAWFMMQNYMGGNMDVVVDPLSTGLEKINIEGCDDLALLPYFERWVREIVQEERDGQGRRPFYGQIYTFNQHYPYLENDNSTATTRYYSSLESFDALLKRLFDLLRETGQLDNTLIVGSSDHGEHPDLREYIRLKRFNSDVISTATYLYAPKNLFPSEEDRRRLRHNTQQAVSTLDLFPTIQHFLYGGSAKETDNLRAEHNAADTSSVDDLRHCITGHDLLSTEITDDRLTVQWNSVSQPQSGYKGLFLGALSGKASGLYVKGMGGKAVPEKFRAWELDYGQCTTVWEADCAMELTEERRMHWLKIINKQPPPASLKISGQVYNTRYMKMLRETLEVAQAAAAETSDFVSRAASLE